MTQYPNLFYNPIKYMYCENIPKGTQTTYRSDKKTTTKKQQTNISLKVDN